MTPAEFVQCFVREKDALLEAWFGEEATAVGAKIQLMRLSSAQDSQLRTVLDAALTDAFYTILVGLDGAASIGGVQAIYQLSDEQGHRLTGAIETEAYEAFHAQKSE